MTPPRPAPHSLEAEEYLLSCCLLDGADVITRCADAGLTVSDFYLAAHAIAFGVINELHNDGRPVDPAVLAEELKRRKELDAVGGFAFITQISSRVPTTAQAGYFIETVRELSTKRQLLRLAMRTAEDIHDTATSLELIDTLEAHLSSVRHRATINKHRSLPDFKLPDEDGPDELLGHNRFLGRGDSCLIVSSSGMGKSSMTMIWAAHLALGWDFLGIPTKRPSKSLIIQAEDSDGDIGELWFSIRHTMKLTGEQMELVRKNVIIIRDKTNRGDAFIATMRGYIARHKPDFVWLNPLHSFAGCKIEDAGEIGRFLREGLNKANRDESFCFMVVHHTPKPMTGKAVADKKWHDVMYDAAGSAELVNWARAVIVLKPTDVEGEFDLVLAKRGRRAGVMQEVQGETTTFLQLTTKIAIKQSGEKIQIEGRKRPFYLLNWETRVIAEQAAVPQGNARFKNATTKTDRYPTEKILDYYHSSNAIGLKLSKTREATSEHLGMSRSAFYDRHVALMKAGLVAETKDGLYRRTPQGDIKANRPLEKVACPEPQNLFSAN
jgi:hypothetical protein